MPLRLPAPAVLCTVLLALVIASLTTVAAAQAQTPFERVTLVDGLDQPTAVAFAPDGRMFVAEKEGRVRVASVDGVLRAEPVIDVSDRVSSFYDGGLLGLAVDAQYPTHPYLYLLYTREHDPEHFDGPKSSLLTRVPVDVGNARGEETVIAGGEGPVPCAAGMDCIPSEVGVHGIGTVRSAPDGTLWAGNGDGGVSWTVGSPASYETYSPHSYRGKILHVQRDGTPVSGHPYCPGATDDRVCAKVYAIGFRNPFRFSLRPGGGLIAGDVGEISWEEVNTVTGPANFGWPCYEGQHPTPGYVNTARCQEEYAKGRGAFTFPTHAYFNRYTPAVPEGSSGAAVIGGPVYQGAGYPAEHAGRIMYADTVRGWLRALEPDGSFLTHLLAPGSLSFPTDVVEGPAALDGDLVVVELGRGRVSRIRYAPTDRTPIAVADATPRHGEGVREIAFSSAGSGDPLGEPVTYEWDFGDGTATSDAANPVHPYAAPGAYVVRLTVTDEDGELSATDQIDVFPGYDPPEVDVATPRDGDAFDAGDRVELSGSAVDGDAQPLTGNALRWDVVLHHNDHEHHLSRFRGTAAAFNTVRNHDADSWYGVMLKATDARGLSSTSEPVEIRPRTTEVRIASEPPGAPVSYDGRNGTAPWPVTAARGFDAPISAANEFAAGGNAWWFDHWSNGGEQAQVVTVPDDGITLTAVYRYAGPAGEVATEPPPPAAPPPLAPLLDGPPPDRTGPTMRLLAANPRRLTGIATDPAGVAAVRVALRRGGTRRCRFVTPAARLSKRRRCDRPLWRSARLGNRSGSARRWTLRLPRPAPAGSYRVLLRAADVHGNVAERWEGGGRTLRLRVPRP